MNWKLWPCIHHMIMARQAPLIIACLVTTILIHFPSRHAKHYNYIDIPDIFSQLVLKKVDQSNSNLIDCNYQNTILNGQELEAGDIYNAKNHLTLENGGEFIPKACRPLIKTAVIVPYRNRTEQLNYFLNYMHYFLQKQNIHYRIFIATQNDTRPFNRAKMLNFGAKVAMSLEFDCLILQDVDLLPLNTGNIYGCAKKPRHMSSSLDTFRYNLPYLSLFGGAISITPDQYQRVNGMSNIYYGWGGEDDDFYRRLEYHDLLPLRFSPEISKYTMMFHAKEKPSPERYNRLKQVRERHRVDGLNQLPDKIQTINTDLYTIVLGS